MSKSKKQEIMGQVSRFSSATLLTQIITAASSILMRKFLGPLQTGVWSLLQVILNYSPHAAIGVAYAAIYRIPFYRGKQDFKQADKIRDGVFSFSFLTSIIFAIGIVIYAVAKKNTLKEEIFYGLLFAAVLVILQRINNLLITALRAYKEFKIAANQMVLSAVVNAVLICIFAYRFKLYGFMFASCLSFVFNIVYILYHFRLYPRWSFELPLIKQMISFGFMLMTTDFTESIASTIDRLMIARMLGLEALGLYSIATLAWGYVFAFPNAASIIFVPNFQERFAENEKAEHLKVYVSKSMFAFLATMPFFIAGAWFFSPCLVQSILPKFAGGVAALKYLILGSFFAALFHPFEQFVVAVKKYLFLLPLGVVSIVFAILFNFIAIKAGYSIAGVAFAMSGVALFRFVAIYFFAGRYLFKGKELWVEFLKVFGAFCYLYILLHFLSQINLAHLNGFFNSCVQFILFLIFFSPFFIRLNREFGVISTVLNMLNKNLIKKQPQVNL